MPSFAINLKLTRHETYETEPTNAAAILLFADCTINIAGFVGHVPGGNKVAHATLRAKSIFTSRWPHIYKRRRQHHMTHERRLYRHALFFFPGHVTAQTNAELQSCLLGSQLQGLNRNQLRGVIYRSVLTVNCFSYALTTLRGNPFSAVKNEVAFHSTLSAAVREGGPFTRKATAQTSAKCNNQACK